MRQNSRRAAGIISVAVLLFTGLQVTAVTRGGYESGGKKILIDGYQSAKPAKRRAIILLHVP